MDQKEEKTLVNQAKAGSREALGNLFETITPKLFGYLVNTVNDQAAAEDMLQNTWMKAMDSLPKFQPRQSVRFSAWLFAIARNECRQHWRKQGREESFDPQKHDRQSNDHGQSYEKILVDQTISQLSEDDRELIRLRYIADLTLNEIAKILNTNSIVARVRVHRALGRARALLVNKTL